jgi:5-methylcytosine-specific restriction endonuclease McrA
MPGRINVVNGECSPDLFLPLVDEEGRQVQFAGYTVNLFSLRLQAFRRSRICVGCGREGTVLRLERFGPKDQRPHFNLYAIESNGTYVLMTKDHGTYVLMTKDHIIPKSKGGPNTLENIQTMCEPCNVAKGDN